MTVLRIAALLLFLVPAPPAPAQTPATGEVHVVRLRADDVELTPAEGKSKDRLVVQRTAFDNANTKWPVKGRTPAGDPIVEIDRKRYVVAAVDVVTDEPRKQVVCIDRTSPKPGATRGFDECKK